MEVEHASEFRYRNSPKAGKSLVIAVSQSGETLDTLEAVREAKTKGLLPLESPMWSDLPWPAKPMAGFTNGWDLKFKLDQGLFLASLPKLMLGLALGRMRSIAYGWPSDRRGTQRFAGLGGPGFAARRTNQGMALSIPRPSICSFSVGKACTRLLWKAL